jgi:aminoglycoside phosphotransferase family enzyme/predicted kinase
VADEPTPWLQRFQARLQATEGPVRLVQTHISWVLLTPTHAYKVKKAVSPGFLDFSTVAARRAACEAEWRLNRRLAPALYLGLWPLDAKAQACEPEQAVEWVLQMRRFDERDRLDARLAAATLSDTDLQALADAVADMHRHAPVLGSPELEALSDLPDETQRWRGLRERSVAALTALLGPQAPAEQQALLQAVDAWLAQQERQLAPLWAQRRAQGAVRDGHGDLHLGNVCWFEGRPLLYDGLEFDDRLRITDTAHDLAFLLMDLWAAGHRQAAWLVASRYLARWPDWAGVPAWPMFIALRALVRWQVACLSAPHDPDAGATYRHVLAQGLVPRRPALILMHGLSGSGKSAVSSGLVAACGALRLRSDEVRAHIAPGYHAGQREAVYERMRAWAGPVLQAGWRVVLDATHLSRAERVAAQTLAARCGVPWVIVSCQAPEAVLRERVRHRRGDASEADEAVLDGQLAHQDVLQPDELRHTWVADTTLPLAHWRQRRTWRAVLSLCAGGTAKG